MAHDSGSRRLATPFRAEVFHLQSLADLSRRTGCLCYGEYLFSLDGNSTGAYLTVYSDSGQTNHICNDPSYTGRDTGCIGTASADTAYIRVDNTGDATAPGYATLDVTYVPPAEGSGLSPIAVVGTSHSGTVNVGVSYYKLSLAANTSYTVSLTGVTGDPDLYVFNNANMSGDAQCHSIMGKDREESCQATSDDSGNLWVVIDGTLSEGGGSYLLQAN